MKKKINLATLLTLLMSTSFLFSTTPTTATIDLVGTPRLDEILFKVILTPEAAKNALITGEVDMIRGPGVRAWIDEVIAAGFNMTFDPMAEFNFLIPNNRDEFPEEASGGSEGKNPGDPVAPLNDPLFRIATQYIWGMERKEASIYAYAGGPWMFGIQSPVPPVQAPWFNPTVTLPESDFAAAWAILEAGGYYVNSTDDRLYNSDGTPVRNLNVLYPAGSIYWEFVAGDFVVAFNEFTDYIGAFSGPTMSLIPRDFGTLVNSLLLFHDFDIVAFELTGLGIYVDWLWSLLHSANIGIWGSNFAGIEDAAFDGNTTIILNSLNESAVQVAAWAIQERFIYEVYPWIPVGSGTEITSYHPDLKNYIQVPNFGALGLDWTWNLMHWPNYVHPDLGTNTLRFALGDEPLNLTPLFENTEHGWDILGRIFTGLTIPEPETLTDMPYASLSWDVEEPVTVSPLGISDGTIITFRLRQDLIWHDGKPVTADDAVYALRLMREHQPARYATVWTDLVYEEALDPYTFVAYYAKAGLYSQDYVADIALMFPQHIWSIAEEFVANGTWADLREFEPATTSYKDWTGEDPPAKYPFMKALVGTGPYVFDYYDRSLGVGRVQRFEEFFIKDTGILVGVDAEYRIDPGTAATYNLTVENLGAKDDTTGELTSATFDVKVYEDDVLVNTIASVTLNAFANKTLGPFTTSALPTGPHTIKVELIEVGSSALLHTYTHSFAVTIPEDINLDYRVSLHDLNTVALAFDTRPGHPRWNPKADIVEDFWINILDLMRINWRFGWTGGSVSWPPPSPQENSVNLAVYPSTTEKKLPTFFNVYISVTNVTNFKGYQFKLYYNTKKMDLINVDIIPPAEWGDQYFSGSTIQDDYSPTQGMGHVWVKAEAPAPPFTGNATLAKLTFRGIKPSSSILDLTGTVLGDYGAYAIPHNVVDGEVTLTLPHVHDVAITDIRRSHDIAFSGEIVHAFVDAWNLGHFEETFSVTAYADSNVTVIGDEINIGNQTLSLPPGEFTTLTYTWNTTGVASGNYTVSAFASGVPKEVDTTDNIYIDSKVEIIFTEPCYDIDIIGPASINLNPNIFSFDWTMHALTLSLGNMTIESTGFDGQLHVSGSKNNTIHLYIDQLGSNWYLYYLPENDTIEVPLWLTFEPGTYSGIYELDLTVCGTHKLKITVNITHISVCGNGVYTVQGGTVSYDWNLTGGSWVYLKAETILPPGWSYSVDPAIDSVFATPHVISLNITAAPDAEEGEIGIVILSAFKNDTNTMFWQFTYFAALDTTPPTIEAIQSPTHTRKGTLLFNATVKDLGTGIENVQLYYSVDNGPWSNQTMNWQEGDTFNSTVYTLEILPIPNNSTLEYYIVATDWLARQTQSGTRTMKIMHDLVTTDVETAKTVVGEGCSMEINITIENQGTIIENFFKVAVYANTTLIGTETVSFLANGTSMALLFSWNTTNMAKGNYTISAFAIPVLGETDTTDNMYINGNIIVAMIGDITGPEGWPDGKVDIRDIAAIAILFGVNYPDPRYNANYDIVYDGKIDIKDIATAAREFGKVDP